MQFFFQEISIECVLCSTYSSSTGGYGCQHIGKTSNQHGAFVLVVVKRGHMSVYPTHTHTNTPGNKF